MNKGIFIRLRESRAFKFVMAFAGVSMLNSLFFPMIAKADGPIAPEFSSFEQVNATQMVDPFTGDFSYNIPLLTVPGPDGGYPINLIYNAGIAPDQEASWVGLGWNLNVGAITRQMRGVPDDFDGSQQITKEMNIKSNWRLGFDFSQVVPKPNEVVGLNFESLISNAGLCIYWDSYTGLGIGYSLPVDLGVFGIGTSISYDPNTGVQVTPQVSLSPRGKVGKYFDVFGLIHGKVGLSYNSRSGTATINAQGLATEAGTVRADYPAEIAVPHEGSAVEFEFRKGVNIAGTLTEKTYNGMYSRNSILNRNMSFDAYGYLYKNNILSNATPESTNLDLKIYDFARGIEYPFSKDAKQLSVPILTYDLYTVNSQGLSTTFRAHRSDVMVMSTAPICYKTTDNGGGMEINTNAQLHIGVNTSVCNSYISSGLWRDGIDELIDYCIEQPVSGCEPFYFKEIGDMSSESYNEDSRFQYNDAIRPSIGAFGKSTQILNDGAHLQDGTNLRKSRDLRSKSIEYFTNSEAQILPDVYYFTSTNSFPYDATPSRALYQYSMHTSSEIGAYSVLGENGNRYEYGLPVYTSQVEYLFNIDPENETDNEIKTGSESGLVDFSTVDVTIENKKGKNHYFYKSSIPNYASQYLLTAVYSADYIDLTGDGPTEDDLGQYTKFNYTKIQGEYNQRFPFQYANYNPGFYTSTKDDQGSFSYYKREQYYLNSIETKTHIAVFRISGRNDAHGAGEYNTDLIGDPNMEAYELDRIDLYCKTDNRYGTTEMVPMKSVHFWYDNSLCQGAPGSSSGKLTLKKVWFTYQDNSSGRQSPYSFDYGTDNPLYSYNCSDKWGVYKPEGIGSNLENPYVNQTEDTQSTEDRNKYAGAWSLKQITLPSGGKIAVEYEMDDYAYVQDKKAMHMAKIIGVGNDEDGINDNYNLNANNNRIFFELEDQNKTATEIAQAFSGINNVYYRALVDFGIFQYDYVSGYAEVIGSGVYDDSQSGLKYGYVDVEPVPVGNGNVNLTNVNPIRKAAWQYMYSERPDLLYPNQSDAPLSLSLITNILTLIQDHIRMITGFYDYCYTTELAKYIAPNGAYVFGKTMYSYLKVPDLNGCMYGGGHRVKTITMNDNWNEQAGSGQETSSFVQHYEYKLTDGRSSGVASYEPLKGTDENAMRELKSKYNGDTPKEYAMYNIESPLCEDYYPTPEVGYSRVLVYNGPVSELKENIYDYQKTGAGYQLYEYYTARDFPVIESSELIMQRTPVQQIIPGLFKSKRYNNHGFSQGYKVITNDMHGKLKSVSQYKEPADYSGFNATVVSKTEYLYKTEQPYNPEVQNQLNNNVRIVNNGVSNSFSEIGVSRDFFLDVQENSEYHNVDGGSVDLNQITPVLYIPTAFPAWSDSYSENRTAVGMKVIHKTGILEKVITTNETKTNTSVMLAWDAATGQPLWSNTNNEFGRPVYTYSYAAHWYYSGMGLASSNYRFTLNNASVSNGIVTTGSTAWFEPGDELIDQYSNKYWVNSVNSSNIEILNQNDELPNGTGLNLKVIRSGHKNLLLEQCGKTVALNWFGASGKYDADVYLELMNSIFTFKTHFVSQTNNNENEYYSATMDCLQSYVNSKEECSEGCDGYLLYKQNLDNTELTLTISSLSTCDFIQNYIPSFQGGTINAVFETSGIINNPEHVKILSIESSSTAQSSLYGYPCTLKVIEQGAIKEISGTFGSCSANSDLKCNVDLILHAEASTFRDNPEREYADAATPGLDFSEYEINKYRYGVSGRWGKDFEYLYYANRKRSIDIDLSRDGTYDNFSHFDWLSANTRWWLMSEVSKRSIDGMPIETKDRLGNYSTVLYGHMGVDRSVIEAAASNCSYNEIAFEGFEDHGSNYQTEGRGHLKFKVGTSSPVLSNSVSHTGKYSVLLSAGTTMTYMLDYNAVTGEYFVPLLSSNSVKSYVVSAWVNMQGTSSQNVVCDVICEGISLGHFTLNNSGNKVDGWKLLKGEFTMPAHLNSDYIFTIGISAGNSAVYIDDIRIHPLNSEMASAVYDPKTLQIKAILDENNFATYFSYDVQGNLVQLKKETENGKQTVKSSWMNIFKKPVE